MMTLKNYFVEFEEERLAGTQPFYCTYSKLDFTSSTSNNDHAQAIMTTPRLNIADQSEGDSPSVYTATRGTRHHQSELNCAGF